MFYCVKQLFLLNLSGSYEATKRATTLLEMSCKICQDHARTCWNVLVRLLQESFKYVRNEKILTESCQILDKILHDISSLGISVCLVWQSSLKHNHHVTNKE